MKEKLIQQLIEEKGKRARYIEKYNNSFLTVFYDPWTPLIEECSAKISEIVEQLNWL